jgi:hypothetical protein
MMWCRGRDQTNFCVPHQNDWQAVMNLQRTFLILIACTLFEIAGCATGSAIVTGTRRPPISAERVTLYLQEPAEFEIIGLVSASSSYGWSEQASVDNAVKELKDQAAKLGANGLLLDPAIGTSMTVVGSVPVSGKTLQGKAILVKRQ